RHGLPPKHQTGGKTADESEQQHGGKAGDHRLIAAPAPAALYDPNRPGVDWLAQEEELKIVRQLRRRGVALTWFLAQALEADSLQVAGHVRPPLSRGHRLLAAHFLQCFQWRSRPERGPTGEQLIQHCPQRVYVARPADPSLLALGLLRGHVARRPA